MSASSLVTISCDAPTGGRDQGHCQSVSHLHGHQCELPAGHGRFHEAVISTRPAHVVAWGTHGLTDTGSGDSE